MTDLVKILRFGWPYFQKYWFRLVAGVLLGVLFGISNACLVWATKTVISRMSPEEVAQQGAAASGADGVIETTLPTGEVVEPGGNGAVAPAGMFERIKVKLEQVTHNTLDPWMPRVDRAVGVKQFIGGLLLLPLLVAFRGYIGYISSYFMSWVSERVVNDLRINVMKKLTSLSLDFFNRSTTGDLLTRVTGDTAALERCFSLGFSDLVKEPVTVISILAALLIIDWQLTLGSLVFLPLCAIPTVILGRKVRKAAKAGWHSNISQSSLLVEMLAGIRVVQAFNMEREQVSRFSKLSSSLVHYSLKTVRAKKQISPIIESVSMLGLGVLILYVAYRQRPVADMVGFLTGMAILYTPIKRMANLVMTFEETRVGVDRLMNILQRQPKVKDTTTPKPFTDFREALTFDNVSFAYEDDMALRNVSLSVKRGTGLGIAGESGSGKSTLINLLFRFYDPVEGAIRLDGTDVREFSLHDLRQHLALVSQEIVLFDRSVAENIACGRTGATREEVEQAARAAHAHDFIMELPEGYDTRLGERGVKLSLGQRQRVSIARAFVRSAPILVLDEATASLDSNSEKEVQAAIDELAENRTVVCVAHRLSTLAKMDRIVVLDRGRIVEQGAFEELVAAGGTFSKMAARQGIFPAGVVKEN